MSRSHRVQLAVFLLVGVAVGFGIARWDAPPADAAPATTAEPIPFPMEARLGANLWMMNSAEYRACCLQIYRCAEIRLKSMLEQATPKPLAPAVVMDLDETVFDNSAFQTYLYREGLEYHQKLWDDYEKNFPQDVRLVPGAATFIDFARRQGAQAVFISNRSEAFRESTIRALKDNGINVKGIEDRLFLKPVGGSSDKAARRELVATRYNVLMYFGDNLRDFSEAFTSPKLEPNASPGELMKATEERLKVADNAAVHWGIDWFVLPNPVYGEWDKMLGKDPKALLRPTHMVKEKQNSP